MRRTIATLLFALVMLTPAHAEVYKDPDGRFNVTRPDGWIAMPVEDRKIVTFGFAHEKTEAAPFESFCIGLYMEAPRTRSASQQELNDALDSQLTPDFWQKAMKSADANFTMTVNSSGSREQGGRKIHNVVFTGTGTKNGETKSAKGKTELHFVPGSLHFVMCMSPTESFEAASPGIEAILTSYEPHPDTLVARNERAAPSVLTMYAAVNFKGVARVLSKDTASLAALGLPLASASATVDGAEPWQVCSAPDFKGICRTIDVAEARPLTIGSARRLANSQSIATLAATALRRALQHPVMSAVVKY